MHWIEQISEEPSFCGLRNIFFSVENYRCIPASMRTGIYEQRSCVEARNRHKPRRCIPSEQRVWW